MLVQLRGDWPGPFHRSVRDKEKKIVSTLTWAPKDTIDITDPLALAAIAADIGKALRDVTPVAADEPPAEPLQEPTADDSAGESTASAPAVDAPPDAEPLNPLRQRKGGHRGSHAGG